MKPILSPDIERAVEAQAAAIHHADSTAVFTLRRLIERYGLREVNRAMRQLKVERMLRRHKQRLM